MSPLYRCPSCGTSWSGMYGHLPTTCPTCGNQRPEEPLINEVEVTDEMVEAAALALADYHDDTDGEDQLIVEPYVVPARNALSAALSVSPLRDGRDA